MIYVERMTGMSSMVRCSVCNKMIRWPEEARAYSNSLKDTIVRFEHIDHPALEGTTQWKTK